MFSTLLGGSSNETGNGIAVDGNGNILVVGQTSSLNFPVLNAVQSASANDFCSAYVTKLNPSVPSYAFSTYLRGSQCERALSVAVDTSGNVYVTGATSSNDFLIANAFQPNFGGPAVQRRRCFRHQTHEQWRTDLFHLSWWLQFRSWFRNYGGFFRKCLHHRRYEFNELSHVESDSSNQREWRQYF
ncbi:MAG TPA: SBBP repeat-containing protein [Pyrinomonadaceae bacterium]